MSERLDIKRGSELELKIESLSYRGKGVAHYNDFVVFVKNAIPGQTVKAMVYRKKPGYAEARSLDIIHESSKAVDAPCGHFGVCGGCKVQNLDYSEQIIEKTRQVEDSFDRLGGFSGFKLDKIVPADPIFNYRNKMEFTFSSNRWILKNESVDKGSLFALGLHIPGRYDKILDIDECHIQPKIGNKILSEARDICLANPDLRPYEPKTHIGFLRYLMLRFGVRTDQIMVNMVTAYDDMNKLSPLIDGLLENIPEITSIVNNVNTRKADVAFGEFETLIYGQPVIEEKIGGLTFEISANSFFKPYLSDHPKKVYGFEVIRSALEDAERNAERNKISNTQFMKANLDTFFKTGQLPRKIPRPDVLILDPPRAGMHPDMTEHIPKLKASKIVYVSCNPTTQARDAKVLSENGYRVDRAVMVDMFPHTPHIETVVLFEKH